MNNYVLAILTFASIVILSAPRKWALLGIMVGVVCITQGQKFELLGFNIFVQRILEVAGFARVIVKREFSFRSLNRIDHAFLMLYIYTTITYLMRSNQPAAYQIGLAVDAILSYFTFRGLIGNMEDFRWFLRAFLILLAPYLALVLIERLIGNNPFAFMGGVLEGALFRGDRPRCWGSFRHPILLGTFGASFFPLYIGMFWGEANRAWSLVGACLCLGIVWASNSGGPLTAFLTGVGGWVLWPVRYKMRLVRFGILGAIATLAIAMKAPVGWHRAYLLDISFQNLRKWWLAGMRLADTHDWFPYTSAALEGADMTNTYLSFGLTAGLGALGLLILLLVRAFSKLGKALISVRGASRAPNETEYILWGLGVMLTVHVVNFLGVCYFDQMNIVWFMQIATISSLSSYCVSGSSLSA